MGIQGIEIDRGPSKLDEILESFKTEGIIEISPRAARAILLERLLAHFRKTEGVNVNVEVLAQMTGDGDELVDFTEARRKFIEERRGEGAHLQDIEAEGNILGQRTRKREI